ncbi:dihydrofolate reductase [Nocardia cyriacigeorgica]|uniref:Bifunctional deaminase-reductase domain protein n=2 Tax=Nocardia cyriacigeorgica TaxID=135487 RepID=H6R066_NOCCG|nr:dihydrofolate reductase family protein [Nocardia cyriacigeorgica]MBF6287241.1 dihydrofolate reductase family protein [Nocardia cyriacigeorgica]MBF6428394.1 dihydrofolate reductase family protein [Nocardia cyriacigeorgica]NEW33494.1 dihydrofolate reductase [Nocardia cyriacigeorgica]CCF62929.1 Bifunctional deaminase-reductase domain protein [Nocardia cyriacigeorgica GUH-2]BDT86549.1 deaminase [Nocardia cyriacigeorgica]
MSKIIAVVSLTLDGVMQAPGRAEEDPRDGFAHGGWAYRFTDEVQGRVMAEHMSGHSGALLLGRRTYLDFAGYWPHQSGNPFTEVLNKTDKYVASFTLSEPLPWQNSILLDGDAVAAVTRLRRERPELDLVVLGSGNLLQSLMAHDLVDEYLLQIHPLVLGSGRRLFDGRTTLGDLQLVDCVPTTTGVLIATYRTAERS